MRIEVYSKPNCGQCMATKKWLARDRVKFTEGDLTGELLDYARATGAISAPLVIVRDHEGNITESWGGFKPAQLKAAVDRYRAYEINERYGKGE